MKMEQTECSETSAYKIQTPGNYPQESIQQNLNYSARIHIISLRVYYYNTGAEEEEEDESIHASLR